MGVGHGAMGDESYKVADPQDEIWKRIALDLNLDGKYTAL